MVPLYSQEEDEGMESTIIMESNSVHRHDQQQQPITTPSSEGYSCLSCRVKFSTAAGQRDHMRTDWHRYNLKRKVIELPPLDAEAFQAKVMQVNLQKQTQATTILACTTCGGQSFRTQAALQHHLGTKKHAERAARAESGLVTSPSIPMQATATTPRDGETTTNWRKELASATTNAELEALLKRKEASAPTLTARHCLFCPCGPFETIPEAIEHMSVTHSFFIPDQSYLVDAEGLLTYLAYKVAVLNTCLYCNGKGKGFFSLEAVRTHMIDMSHCKVEYELDGGQDELNEWYDFGTPAEDSEDEEWEDVEGADEDDMGDEDEVMDLSDATPSKTTTVKKSNAVSKASTVIMTPDESQLILPSGAVIGSRAFNTVWRQHLPALVTDASLSDGERIGRAHSAQTKALRVARRGTDGRDMMMTAAPLSHEQVKALQKQSRSVGYARQVFLAKVGQKHNNLQHYFRSQLGFGV